MNNWTNITSKKGFFKNPEDYRDTIYFLVSGWQVLRLVVVIEHILEYICF